MSRATPFRPEHAGIVRELRQVHPRLAIGGLAALLAERCGFDRIPSVSAMHRFMQAHGIERVQRPWPHDGELLQLARRARSIARELARHERALRPGMERAQFVGNVSAAFHALLFSQAGRVGVPHVAEVAQAAEGWLAEAQR